MSTRPGPLGLRIAAELRAELGRQTKSRRWLAEQIGHPHNTVARWVGGETCPPVDELDHMFEALGLDLALVMSEVKYRIAAEVSGSVPPHSAVWGRRATDFHAAA